MDNKDFKYYISYFAKEFSNLEHNRPWLSFDENNIVVSSTKNLASKFGVDTSEHGDYYYHPCEIAQAVCAYYDLYIESNDKRYIDLLFSNIKWLSDNYVEYKDTYVYPFPFAIKTFGEKEGWISGMYQGIILSAFIRASILSNDNSFTTAIQKVYNSYSLKLGDKYGFMVEDEYGLWYEESMLNQPTHILNGFVYAIYGLADYYKFSKDEEAGINLNKCYQTLENTIPHFDMGYWSFYDLNGTIASYDYHNKMHIPILYSLYELTGKDIFKEYAIKWQTYSTSKICKLRKKIYSFKKRFFNI